MADTVDDAARRAVAEREAAFPTPCLDRSPCPVVASVGNWTAGRLAMGASRHPNPPDRRSPILRGGEHGQVYHVTRVARQQRNLRRSLHPPYICYMNTISSTLALLKPADLFPAWKWIDMMEQCGDMKAGVLIP